MWVTGIPITYKRAYNPPLSTGPTNTRLPVNPGGEVCVVGREEGDKRDERKENRKDSNGGKSCCRDMNIFPTSARPFLENRKCGVGVLA